MILVNRNFGNPVLAEVIGDMFKGSSDEGQNVDWVNHTNTLATNSSLVAGYRPYINSINNPNTNEGWEVCKRVIDSYIINSQNFFLVTEHFLKTLDKVYTKIWNESFTETGIYNPENLATIYNGFVSDTSLKENSVYNNDLNGPKVNFMLFKKFVDRCITAGILIEEDRLQYEDQISLTNLNRADLSTQIDLDNKLITFTAAQPIDIKPDLNAMANQYLEGKKLFLMMTPYLPNESTLTGPIYVGVNTNSSNFVPSNEPFANYSTNRFTVSSNAPTPDYIISVKRPIAFFKPKTDASKFGRSLPLATHLIWTIGTPADEAAAIANGTTPPDLVFDHLDRISHIDSLVLKIKYDKLQF